MQSASNGSGARSSAANRVTTCRFPRESGALDARRAAPVVPVGELACRASGRVRPEGGNDQRHPTLHLVLPHLHEKGASGWKLSLCVEMRVLEKETISVLMKLAMKSTTVPEKRTLGTGT